MKLNQTLMVGLASLGLTTLAGLGALSIYGSAPQRLAEQAHPPLSLTDPIATAGIAPEAVQDPHQDPQLDRLKTAVSALADGRIDEVRSMKHTLAAGSIDRDLIEWLLAMSGSPAVGAGEIGKTMRRLSQWPGQDAIARNHERALARGWLGNVQLRTAFAAEPPKTFQAAYALAKSHVRGGRADRARPLIVDHWHTRALSAEIERETLDLFADVLTRDDHRIRYFNMMVRERIRAGGRIAKAAGLHDLHDAWAAVIRGHASASRLIADVPDAVLASEAGLYMRVEHLRRAQRFDEAADLLLALPEEPDALTNPDAWWNERRIVSRSLRERGEVETGYQIVAAHRGGSATTQVDAAFHAGWYALRGLRDPARAEAHFVQIEQIARGPSSRARAAYWLGRTALAADDHAQARAHFQRAAQYPTVFYGQLAAQQLGQDRLAIAEPVIGARDGQLLRSDRVFAAIDRLGRAGGDRWLQQLYLGYAQKLTSPGAIAGLANHARRHGRHAIGLRIAKAASWRGVDMGLGTHPVGAIPAVDAMNARDRALAYAVARQESEFNTNAVSRANARGLLQLLPSTAQDVAGRLDLSYSASRLTADPAFNALLGTHYLDEQRDRFGGSYVLTFIAYNAGSGRARQWIERFGDPRGLSLDETIDWIEQIPFPETRGYVQKVMENMTVYKARFGLELTIEQDLTGRTG